MRHRYECPVRWGDEDQLHHVNNVRYADYLQEARIDFLRALDLRPHGAGEGTVVVGHELSYLAPLHYDGRDVSVELWVEEVRAATFTVGYEVFREEGPASGEGQRTVHLRARTRLAPYDLVGLRPRRLTPEEQAVLAPYVEEASPRRHAPLRVPVVPSELGHYPVHVRFSDLDPYGHVNNVMHLEYFQEARLTLINRLWADLRVGDDVAGVVVAQVDVDYLRPLHAGPVLDCWTVVARVGERSAVLAGEIRLPDDTVGARASVVLVFVDPATGLSVVPPAEQRERLVAQLGTVVG